MWESKHAPFTCKNDTCRGVWLSELTNIVTYQRPLLQCPQCGQRYAWTYYTSGGAELTKVPSSYEVVPRTVTPTPIVVDVEAVLDDHCKLLSALEAHAVASAKELNTKILAYVEDRLLRNAMAEKTAKQPAEYVESTRATAGSELGVPQALLDEVVAFLAQARSPDSLTTARDNLAEAMTLLDRLVVSQKKL